jgi:3-oxoacyl-[acyl-carrier-protein] synthase-3
MQQLCGVTISGTGMQVPDQVITNQDLEKLMDTSDEWITQRTGIKERRHVIDEAPSDLAVDACKKALDRANLQVEDIDLLIIATLSPEHYFPGTSSWVHRKLGMRTTPAMDLRCQCSGFLYALSVGRSFVASGQYERVMICGVEVHSRALDMTTRGRDVAVLFGDGAGAAILERSDRPESGILSCHLHSQGEHAEKLWVDAPRMDKSPYLTPQMIEEGRASPQMDGKFVFKHAVSRLPQVVDEALAHNNLSVNDIDHFMFHQANLRINEYVARDMNIPSSKVHNNIQKYGNCSSASLPMLLDEAYGAKKINPGDLICLAAFGSGFTWASALLRW